LTEPASATSRAALCGVLIIHWLNPAWGGTSLQVVRVRSGRESGYRVRKGKVFVRCIPLLDRKRRQECYRLPATPPASRAMFPRGDSLDTRVSPNSSPRPLRVPRLDPSSQSVTQRSPEYLFNTDGVLRRARRALEKTAARCYLSKRGWRSPQPAANGVSSVHPELCACATPTLRHPQSRGSLPPVPQHARVVLALARGVQPGRPLREQACWSRRWRPLRSFCLRRFQFPPQAQTWV